MFQYNHKGRRWYHEGGKWYTSVTEFVKNALPTPPHLLKWYKENSAEFIDDTLRDSAKFGTDFHHWMEVLTTSGRLTSRAIDDERMLTMVSAGAQFLADYEVEPILTEARLKHDASGAYPLDFAGTVDLVAKTKNGYAIIDWKTGGIWDTHKYQMMCYLLALRQGSDEFAEQEFQLINVRPKEWRGAKPTYEAKTWKVTDGDWRKLNAMMMLYEFEPPKPRKVFDEFTLGQAPSWDEVEPQEYALREMNEGPF